MNLQHGPKIRTLTSNETLSTLETWKSTIQYGLRLNPEFKEYLEEGYIWGRKTRINPSRELKDVYKKETIVDPKDNTKTEEVLVKIRSKEECADVVDLLLEQVANYCPHVPRTDITKDCRSMKEVWVTIRSFYNKQLTGASMNDVWNVRRELDESPQALYARIKQLYIDNFLTTDGLIHTENQQVQEDEEMSPTLQNSIVLHWLQALNPNLRDIVTTRFITQLRDHTYAAILPEISRSVDALLEELTNTTTVNRVNYPQNRASYPNKPFQRPNYSSNNYKPSFQSNQPFQQPSYSSNSYKPAFSTNQSSGKHCEFCKLTHKKMFHTHNIQDCLFIKRLNSQSSTSIHQVTQAKDDWELQCEEFNEYAGEEEIMIPIEHVLNLVKGDASPVLELQSNNQTCMVTLDTGAPCNLIKTTKAKQLNAIIKPTAQKVRMADGVTYLDVVGETEITLYRNNKPYHLPAIVCNDTDTEILAGVPFMKRNDVGIRPFNDEIILGGKEFVKYSPHGTS